MAKHQCMSVTELELQVGCHRLRLNLIGLVVLVGICPSCDLEADLLFGHH